MRPIPPAWTLAISAAQRVVAGRGRTRDYPGRVALGVGLAVTGAGLMGAASWQLHRARTTIDPRRPAAASSLVTSGLYGLSRNPIYLADALLLAAHAAWLASPVSLLGIPALGVALGRQIAAEETALRGRFGAQYESYLATVPRWVGGPSRLRRTGRKRHRG